MKKIRRRIDVNLVELDQVLDSALQAPLSEADHDKLKETLHALPPPGHGRNGAEAFGGAQKVDIKHQKLSHGDRCPECRRGNV
ncbi:MAG: hypothetical protein ABSG62_24600 [Terracidiphilus sp.]